MPTRTADARPKPVDDLLALIGNTPMARITRIDTGPCELYVKLENQNPGGSIKDRIALTMIEAAEQDGSLRPGGTLIEATPAIPAWVWRWWRRARAIAACW